MIYVPHQSFDFDDAVCIGYVTQLVKLCYPRIKLSKWPRRCASFLREDGCEFSLVGSSLNEEMVAYHKPIGPASSEFHLHDTFRHFLSYLENLDG